MRILVLSALVCTIVACSTVPVAENNWPANMPPRDYFIEYYSQNKANQAVSTLDAYLLWITRFYQGWELYQRGWLQASDELIASVDNSADIPRARELTYELGRIVAAEWAKDKRFRVIHTKHLIIWGNAMAKSMVENEQLFILEKIILDANHLLLFELQSNEIAYNRYYQEEEFGIDGSEFD